MPTPEPTSAPTAWPPAGSREQPGEMSGRVRWLVLATVAVLLIGGFVVVQRVGGGPNAPAAAPAQDAGLKRAGERAPDFTARTTTGEEVSLAAYRGRPVWLTFGASWCAGCRAEAPDIEAAYAASKDEGVAVLAVYLSEDSRAVQAYADKVGMSYVQIPDPQGAVCNLYGARAVPMHVFVGPDGVIRRVHAGIMTPDAMKQAIAEVRA